MSANLGIKIGVEGTAQAEGAMRQLAGGMQQLGAATEKTRAEMQAAKAAFEGWSTSNSALPILSNQVKQVGVSAGQTAAALRQLPLQMQDVLVSLQAGQAPLTVLLQQGSQIAGSFGGVGAALKNTAGYVLGLVNPFTVAAAAVGTLGLAYYKGSKEADAFNKTIGLTGNAVGASASQMAGIAATLGNTFGVTVGQAAEAVNALAATGQVGRASLQGFASSAIAAEKALGLSLDSIAKNFADLNKDPVGASARLTETMNYLTASTYEQIKAAKDLGQTAKAAALAQGEYDQALKAATNSVVQNLGYIEKAWGGIKTIARESWDAMLGLGRQTSIGEQLSSAQANLRAAVDARKKVSGDFNLSKVLDAEITKLKEQVAVATELDNINKRAGDAAVARNAANKDGIAAINEITKANSAALTKQEQMNKALADYRKQIDALRGTNPNSELLNPAQIAKTESAIRAQFKSADKQEAVSAYDQLNKRISEFAALQDAASAQQGKLSEGQRLAVKITEDMASAGIKLNAADKQRLQTSLDAALATEQRLLAEKEVAKFMDDSIKVQAAAVNQAEKSIESTKKQAAAEREAMASIGLTKEAIAELTAAKHEDNAATLDRLASIMAESGEPELLIKKYREEAAALRDLAAAKRERGAAETAEAISKAEAAAAKKSTEETRRAAEKAQQEWQRAADKIESSITDALMRGFESGKGFAENLRDTLKNMFNTLVLRPIVQAAVGGLTGLGGSSAMAGNSTTGLIGAANTLQSMGSAVSGGITSFGTTVGSLGASMQYGTAVGSQQSAMLAAQEIGMGTTTGGVASIGPYASALGGVLVGVMAGKMISGGYSAAGKSGNAAVGVGTAVGLAVGGPIGAAIGGAIGGLVNRTFGMKAKSITDEGLTGTFGPQGADVQGFSDWQQKGGWARSSKSGRDITAVSSDLDRLLDGAVGQVRTSTADYAKAIGLSADATATFSKAITISLKGLDDAGRQKAIDAAIAGFGEDLSAAVLGDAGKAFARMGETSAQALQRLGSSLSGVNAALDTMSQALLATSLNGADAASKLTDLFGGLDKFAQATEAYFQAFYSEAERTQKGTDQLTKALTGLGLAMPDTLSGFRALVEAQDLTTEAGRKAYAALISLSPAFAQVTNAAGALAAKLGKVVAEAINGTLAEVEKQMTASQSAANAAREAADAYRSAGQTLKDTAREILMGVGNVTQNTAREYQRVLGLARSGDVAAMGALPGAATAMLSEGRDTATTRVQAMLQAAQTAADLAGVGDAATGFAGQKDYQAQLYDVNTAVLEVLRANLQAGNVSTDLLKQQLAALNGINTMIVASKDVTFEGLKAVEGETGTVASVTELVARATGNNETLSKAILQQLQVPDAGSNFLAQTISTSNEFLAARMEGVIAAINRQTESQQAELKRQQDLTRAQKQLEEFFVSRTPQIQAAESQLTAKRAEKAGYDQAIAAVAPNYNSWSYGVRWDFDNVWRPGSARLAPEIAGAEQALGAMTDAYIRQLAAMREQVKSLGGVPAFANGGAFTNGVVTRPTAFSMGQMGEAGPEAIMPLTNINGQLGVRAQMSGAGALVDEVRALRSELVMLRAEARAGAVASQEHLQLQRRMTRNGQSMPITGVQNDTLKVEVAA